MRHPNFDRSETIGPSETSSPLECVLQVVVVVVVLLDLEEYKDRHEI
jgi:hypothetical protein